MTDKAWRLLLLLLLLLLPLPLLLLLPVLLRPPKESSSRPEAALLLPQWRDPRISSLPLLVLVALVVVSAAEVGPGFSPGTKNQQNVGFST
jgi:hypothetical protein